jgi:hypothetical protein
MTYIFMVAYCLINPPAGLAPELTCGLSPPKEIFTTLDDCQHGFAMSHASEATHLQMFCVRKQVSTWERAQ